MLGAPRLEHQIDFDRLVQLHHRDWYLRNGCPSHFVAIGWMYSRADHREQVVQAFRDLSERPPEITLIQFLPDARVFIERYCQRQDRLPGTLWQEMTALGSSAREAHALKMFNNYLEHDWQPPADATSVEVVRDEPAVQRLIRRVFQD